MESSSKYNELQSNYRRLNELYNQSIQTNSQLKEEQKRIQIMLENVDTDGIDERSDILSYVKSVNIQRSQKSPVRIQRVKT